ncbi:hypothetical protein NL676_019798 [Syzygium grande]|nr:hypothetical protein NL676_019798 [Syzygium grande]
MSPLSVFAWNSLRTKRREWVSGLAHAPKVHRSASLRRPSVACRRPTRSLRRPLKINHVPGLKTDKERHTVGGLSFSAFVGLLEEETFPFHTSVDWVPLETGMACGYALIFTWAYHCCEHFS